MLQQSEQATGSQSQDANSKPPTVDINTLAAIVQQLQQQNADIASSSDSKKAKTAPNSLPNGSLPNGLSNTLPNGLSNTLPNGLSNTLPNGLSNTLPNNNTQPGGGDAQSMMEQIAELTKNLENERSKSKALQEEKKREMRGFLGGIRDYINSLDGVKDPNAKQTFMQGIENMANNGMPNGVYDIMVSASAQNEQNMKTIEALTKGYTQLKEKYETPGQFAEESSRFVDPTLRIVDSGSKRKIPESEAPLGMWDAFGQDIARLGYATQKDLLAPS